MFVVLEHTPGVANADVPLHWDFMLELPGYTELATWRLLSNPLQPTVRVAAVRLGDHRRNYLDFEGEVSNNRGRVRRLDRGEARILSMAPKNLRFALSGDVLKGEFEIRSACEGVVFLKIDV